MPEPQPCAYYVYYRVDPRHTEVARLRVRTLLARVRASCGTRGRCLRKSGEPLLWMEIYDPVIDADRFEAALSAAALEVGMDATLQPGSTRKLERFEAWE